MTTGSYRANVSSRSAVADTSSQVERRMSLIALLLYLPRTGSLASHERLCASWFSVRTLARAFCSSHRLAPSLL